MTDLFDTSPGATPIPEELHAELIPSLTTRAELNEAEQENILDARAWAMRPATLKRAELLTDHFARELHRRMFRHVWKWAGKYRTRELNLGLPVARLTEEMHHAFADARAWREFGTYPAAEAAVRLHHRLAAIHPWVNGNGRHARLMADVWMASRGEPPLSWGAGRQDQDLARLRRDYLAALRTADAQDFRALIEFARS